MKNLASIAFTAAFASQLVVASAEKTTEVKRREIKPESSNSAIRKLVDKGFLKLAGDKDIPTWERELEHREKVSGGRDTRGPKTSGGGKRKPRGRPDKTGRTPTASAQNSGVRKPERTKAAPETTGRQGPDGFDDDYYYPLYDDYFIDGRGKGKKSKKGKKGKGG